MEPDKIFIDIKTCGLTLAQVLEEVERLKKEYPDYEIFLDGDAYAVVGRRRIRYGKRKDNDRSVQCVRP